MQRSFEAILGGLILAAALFVLAFSAAASAVFPWLSMKRAARRSSVNRGQACGRAETPAGEFPGEFCFERGVEAYEQLIAAAVRKRRA